MFAEASTQEGVAGLAAIAVIIVIGQKWYESWMCSKNPDAYRAMKATEQEAKERSAERYGKMAKGGLGLLGRLLKR